MSTAQWFPNTPAGRLKALAQHIRETPYLMWSDDYPKVAREGAVEIDRLERENAALHRLAYDMAAEMEQHGGEQAFDSLARYRAEMGKEDKS